MTEAKPPYYVMARIIMNKNKICIYIFIYIYIRIFLIIMKMNTRFNIIRIILLLKLARLSKTEKPYLITLVEK